MSITDELRKSGLAAIADRIDAERLCDENAKLRDENARLRSCLSDDADNARQIMGENAKLRDQLEEQKCFAADLERDVRALRELVRDMWEFGFGDNSGANDARAWHERTDELEERMHELGIEVDE